MSSPGAFERVEPGAWARAIAPSLSCVGEIASEFRPLETGAREGDLTRFLEPERVPVSSGHFEPDPRAAVTNVLGRV